MVMDSIQNLYFISLALSILILILFLYFLSGSKYFSNIANSAGGSRFDGLDGLRGYLAMFVFFYHLYVAFFWGESGLWEFPDFKLVSALGKIPVFVFFVITGFLFASKIIYSNRKPFWIGLYVGRFFRIQPLFMFVIMLIMLLSAVETDEFEFSISDVYGVLVWLLYAGGEGRGNFFGYGGSWLVIAGVHWTLRYEWLFYLSLPTLFIVHSFNVRIFYALVVLGLLIGATGLGIAGLSFFYASLFLVGILAASVSAKYVDRICSLFSPQFGSEILLFISLFSTFGCYIGDILVGIQVSLFLMFIALRGGANFLGILRWKGSILLGEISYSIYLTHGVVIFLVYTVFDLDTLLGSYFVLAPVATILVVISSVYTYVLIEKRFIDVGYRVRSKLAT